jgi:hypothetical protein
VTLVATGGNASSSDAGKRTRQTFSSECLPLFGSMSWLVTCTYRALSCHRGVHIMVSEPNMVSNDSLVQVLLSRLYNNECEIVTRQNGGKKRFDTICLYHLVKTHLCYPKYALCSGIRKLFASESLCCSQPEIFFLKEIVIPSYQSTLFRECLQCSSDSPELSMDLTPYNSVLTVPTPGVCSHVEFYFRN